MRTILAVVVGVCAQLAMATPSCESAAEELFGRSSISTAVAAYIAGTNYTLPYSLNKLRDGHFNDTGAIVTSKAATSSFESACKRSGGTWCGNIQTTISWKQVNGGDSDYYQVEGTTGWCFPPVCCKTGYDCEIFNGVIDAEMTDSSETILSAQCNAGGPKSRFCADTTTIAIAARAPCGPGLDIGLVVGLVILFVFVIGGAITIWLRWDDVQLMIARRSFCPDREDTVEGYGDLDGGGSAFAALVGDDEHGHDDDDDGAEEGKRDQGAVLH